MVAGQLINQINQLLATHGHYGNKILSPLEFNWSPLHALVVNPSGISKNYVAVCTSSNLSGYEFVQQNWAQATLWATEVELIRLSLTCMIMGNAAST